MPQISVIVPVYNVASYLGASISALQSQSVRDIEILCIDDDSRDTSYQLLLEIAAEDQRVKVIRHTVNRGLSAARNTGIRAASAPWILFVDSDDLVSSHVCEHTLAAAAETGADAVFFAYATFRDGESPPAEPSPSRAVRADRHTLLARPAFAWTKLVKRSLLVDKHIEFPEGFCFEDVPVHWKIVLEAQKPVFLDEALVWYRQRQGSITYRKDWSRADGLRTYDLVREWLRSTGHWELYGPDFLRKELANFANTHAYYAIANPALLPRLMDAIHSRMTLPHWACALDGEGLLRWQRDFLLSLCRPHGAEVGCDTLIASLRHSLRDRLRRIYHYVRR